MGRVIDDLMVPTRKLRLTNPEITILSALIILDPDARGLSTDTSLALLGVRDRVQNALFNVSLLLESSIFIAGSEISEAIFVFPVTV